MKPVVVFDGVWKRFQRGERHDSLRDMMPSLMRRVLGRKPSDARDSDFWALENVSFTVGAGEAFGIIGPNGAGKSTTLKLLTRIIKPTRGSCAVHGRVGALIEVAAGFHPDLTGRENIFLQGAIMGMKQADITRRLDAIVDFAGVSGFIDTPVKRYSSGMNARLGFAIAAHLDPDVLIVDEVLSVGDMAFQERCIHRMLEFKKQGTSIVFVSHNLQAVTMLCERALYLRNRTIALGTTPDAIRSYVQQPPADVDDSSRVFVLKRAELSTALGRTNGIAPGTRLTQRATYDARIATSDLTFSFVVYRSTDRFVVYDANFTAAEAGICDIAAGAELTIDFRFNAQLVRGMYHIESAIFHNPTQTFLSTATLLGSFTVDEARTWAGVANLDASATACVSTPVPVGGGA